MDAKSAGQLLRDKRTKLGLTLTQVAEKTGVSSKTYLAGLEAGRVSVGRSKHLQSLASVLGLSEKELAWIAGQAPAVGSADLHKAVRLQAARSKGKSTQEIDKSDPRTPSHLNIATALAHNWDAEALGAYTLDADPNEVVVVNPREKALKAGHHYLVLDQEGHAIVRTVCVREGKLLKLLCSHAVMKKGKFKVMGRILFEARAL